MRFSSHSLTVVHSLTVKILLHLICMRFSNQKTALTVIIQGTILCFLVPLLSQSMKTLSLLFLRPKLWDISDTRICLI